MEATNDRILDGCRVPSPEIAITSYRINRSSNFENLVVAIGHPKAPRSSLLNMSLCQVQSLEKTSHRSHFESITLSVLQNLFFVSQQILLSPRSWRKWDTDPCHQLFSVCYIRYRYFVGNFNVRLMAYHALSRWIASMYQPHILFKPLRSILILISFIVVGK